MRFKDFFRPTSVEGALAAYESSAHNAVYVAGCTDVLVAARESARFDGATRPPFAQPARASARPRSATAAPSAATSPTPPPRRTPSRRWRS